MQTEIAKQKVLVIELFLIIPFAVLTIFAVQFDYFRFDLPISRIIQSINLPGFDFLMNLTSRLGDIWLGGASVLFFMGIAVAVKKWKTALMIFVSTYSAMVLNQILKHIVDRPRPDPTLIHLVGALEKSGSFPSGHVMFYVGLYGFLLFLIFTQFRKGYWLRPILLTLFEVMIILVGISRIYLGAHWFSDVLGAYLLGFSWLIVIIWAYNLIRK